MTTFCVSWLFFFFFCVAGQNADAAFPQVVFRARRGISYMGDLVIDDIGFLHCSPPLPTSQPCTPEQFACVNGHCIPENNLCDFINHCGDNSDEDHYICSELFPTVYLPDW